MTNLETARERTTDDQHTPRRARQCQQPPRSMHRGVFRLRADLHHVRRRLRCRRKRAAASTVHPPESRLCGCMRRDRRTSFQTNRIERDRPASGAGTLLIDMQEMRRGVRATRRTARALSRMRPDVPCLRARLHRSHIRGRPRLTASLTAGPPTGRQACVQRQNSTQNSTSGDSDA